MLSEAKLKLGTHATPEVIQLQDNYLEIDRQRLDLAKVKAQE
jgi:hypothetical protein